MELTINDKIDQLEANMQGCQKVDCPLNHRFIGGMYIREILMPAGSLITSMEHLTTHPYFVLQGRVSVYSDNFGEQLITAPYTGTTIPNTRRVLFVHEDCVWVTIHRTDVVPKDESQESIEEAVKIVEDTILSKRENMILGGRIKNNIITHSIEVQCPS